ncbi:MULTISPECIES: helix-turn-helix domain-containing protein [unclassified Streptomyces]|uniref:helix-turn-helix domain-containing protein n=1 Tax=unclassified Streptomyces TaxID=2593676 RepID=UPI0015CF5CCD|nr:MULTISPECIES: helix-turn-helix transcriptional regulator [unclassified Streptomyces]
MRQRRIAADLRRLRERKGLSAEQVVSKVPGLNLPKLSRYENARSGVKPEIVEALLDLYECDEGLREVLLEIARQKDQRGWWKGYSDTINPLYTDLISMEAQAVEIKAFELTFVPGLLQTPDYATAIISRLSAVSTGVDAMVDVRIARQRVLTRMENPVKLCAVIHESALAINVGDDVMREQLSRLVKMSRLPNVHIQVMPATARPNRGFNGAFTLLEFPQRALDIVLTPGMVRSSWVEDPAEVDIYRGSFHEIMAAALNVDDSLEFITQKRDELP